MPPATIDVKYKTMEVNSRIGLNHMESNEEKSSTQEATIVKFETGIEDADNDGDRQQNRPWNFDNQEEQGGGIAIKVEPDEMEVNGTEDHDSSWISPITELVSPSPLKDLLKVENVTQFSPRNAFRSPQKKPVKKSVQVVVWNKKPQPIILEQSTLNNNQPTPRNDNFFVVKYLKSDDKENIKANKNTKKKAVGSKLQLRKSSKSLKRKRRNKVQVTKQKDYQKLLQSYITSQHIGEPKRMKGNGDPNLMWLLDFKVDTLFQQEEDNRVTNSTNSKRSRSKSGSMAAPQADQTRQDHRESFDVNNPEHAFTVDLGIVDDVAHFEQVECPVSITEPKDKRRMAPPPRRNCTSEISFDEQGKPRCTYTELIERALTESGGLTVSEIYQWISDHYPFFRPNDDRWKNSVRHNLSINPYFKKGDKARSGAGHLWTISEESRALRHAVRKKGNESQEISMSIENETDRAVASILGQYNLAKANMEIGGQPIQEADACETRTGDSSVSNSPNTEDDSKVMEFSPSTVLVDYGNGDFPGGEFTIELGGISIPETGGLDFQDLISSGRLIFIQADDQEADKENNNMHCEVSEMEQYMDTDFSEMHSESQATERISGQLISEALTQDFSANKPIGSITPTYIESHNSHEMNFERQNLSIPGSQDFMALESIDPLALQDVMHVANGNSSLEHYHSMNGTGFEPRDIVYSCNYDQEVIL